MEKMTGAQILIETLVEQGVTDVFGYPGGQVLDIYDEIYKASDRIRHVLTAHEQGAAHAADGYARATGKVGVVISTSGPGATNLVTGIATAMLDSVPMVVITGNVPSTLIGKDAFQEVNITGITMPITKHNYFVSDIKDLKDALKEAFMIAKSGRPGPVLVDIPKDVQSDVCDFEKEGVAPNIPQRIADEDEISSAVRLIKASKRPYIYIGGGAANAEITEEIKELAEKLDAFIGCTLMGLSVIPHSYERFLGMQGMHGHFASTMANKEADLIIGIGVRFSDRATGDVEKYALSSKIIQLDSDLAEINKNVTVDVGIAGDVASALKEIIKKCNKKKNNEWNKFVGKLKEEERKIEAITEEKAGSRLTPKKIFDVINAVKDENTMIVTDVGQHQMWTAQYVELSRPRRFASSGGLSTMGYGLGAAIGAYVGCGEKTVLITGDGSFGMNLNELATAVTYNIPVCIVLINNGVLGMVRQWQTIFFEERYSCSVLERKTDYVKLAEAFGARGKKVATPEEFDKAFKEAMKSSVPYVIDTVIKEDELVLPMLPPGGALEDIIVKPEGDKK